MQQYDSEEEIQLALSSRVNSNTLSRQFMMCNKYHQGIWTFYVFNDVEYSHKVNQILDVLENRRASEKTRRDAFIWLVEAQHYDFAGKYLERIVFKAGELPRVNLQLCNLSSANFSGCNMEWANLKGAKLQATDLQDCNLQNTQLELADMQWSYLRRASLQNANLNYAELLEADLHQCDLRYASMRNCILQESDLTAANLEASSLNSADLTFADLSHANLKEADLQKTDLEWCCLNSADLASANLQDACLKSAYIGNVKGLTAEQLCTCKDIEGIWGAPDNILQQIHDLRPCLMEWWDGKSTSSYEDWYALFLTAQTKPFDILHLT